MCFAVVCGVRVAVSKMCVRVNLARMRSCTVFVGVDGFGGAVGRLGWVALFPDAVPCV